MTTLKCPRDGTELTTEMDGQIQVDKCGECSGRWLDNTELGDLEATVGTEDERRGMIDYAKKASELTCPVCAKTMVSFNYRAYNLELDACEDQHGYWLDAGEDGRVRDVMKERVEGLARSVTAEASWAQFLGQVKSPGMWDNIKGMFGGKK